MTSSAKNEKSPPLVFLPLGGAGEIGLNAYAYGVGPPDDRKWLLVDCGVSFADLRDPGIDLILPDLSYLEAERGNLLGLVLTHAHEDHYGAVAHLWQRLRCPVYATPFTAILLNGRLAEFGLEGEVEVHEHRAGDVVELGPFSVEFVGMTHSIPEPMGLAVTTPQGMVFHTGDWKIDDAPVIGAPTDLHRLEALGKAGCLALICDSTNAMREGRSVTEMEVGRGLADIIENAEHRVAVTTFASNLARLVSVVRAAHEADRSVVAAGRAMWRILDAGRKAGLLDDLPPVLDVDAFDELPRENTVVLLTGSQGEGRAALARVADSTHPQIALDPGDLVVFSSRTIPGNEKAVAGVQNALARQGIEIITSDDAMVHSSGHPRRGELEELYGRLKPRIIVPMHGEARHLAAQAKFAREVSGAQTLIVENGDIAQLAPGKPAIVDEAPSGRLHVDGRVIVPGEAGPARARSKLAVAGLVMVSLVRRKGKIIGDPQIALFGLPDETDDGAAMAETIAAFTDGLIDLAHDGKSGGGGADLAEVIRRALRREIDALWGKKPQVQVFVHDV